MVSGPLAQAFKSAEDACSGLPNDEQVWIIEAKGDALRLVPGRCIAAHIEPDFQSSQYQALPSSRTFSDPFRTAITTESVIIR